jgi:hypothetical protein
MPLQRVFERFQIHVDSPTKLGMKMDGGRHEIVIIKTKDQPRDRV